MGYESVFRPELFAGTTIIVTGGGSGIGRCTAHELASLGAHVVLLGRTESKLQTVVAEIAEDGGQASYWTCDVRDDERVAQVVGEVVAARGGIGGLVNNAGGQFPAPLETISPRGFDAVIRNNLHSIHRVSSEVYKASMSEHGGAIVNVLADMWRGMPGMGHSGAARAGAHNLTMTMAVEWAKSGVRANAIAPGYIASSGLDNYDPSVQEFVRGLGATVPLNRLGVEAECSAAICFLLSPAAAYLTGECLRVDGGSLLTTPVWPRTDHDRSKPFQGFHRYQPPKALTPRETD